MRQRLKVRSVYIVVSLAILALIAVVQFWIVTAGTFSFGIPDVELLYTTPYYAELADSFAHGQVDMRSDPPTALARLSDPYDSDARQQAGIYARHDFAYYKGRYFLYFGPTPALILLGLQTLTGITDVPDSVLVVAFMFGITLAGVGILLLLRRALFPKEWIGLPLLAGLVLGLGHPTLYMLARPAVYEAAMSAGQFFLLLGLFFAFSGLLFKDADLNAGYWLTAGICWALALGSRYSLAPAITVLCLSFAYFQSYLGRQTQTKWQLFQMLCALFAPLIVALVILGLYNSARFDSYFASGQRYVLQNVNLFQVSTFSLSYVPRNISHQLLSFFRFSDSFPFVMADGPVVGLVWTTPFVILTAGTLTILHQKRTEHTALETRIVIMLTVASLVAAIPVLSYFIMESRYQFEFSPLLILLAFIGTCSLRATFKHWQLHFGLLAAILVLVSLALGVLLGVQGPYEHYRRHNPALFATLWQQFSLSEKANWNAAVGSVIARGSSRDVVLITKWGTTPAVSASFDDVGFEYLDLFDVRQSVSDHHPLPDFSVPLTAYWILFDWEDWSSDQLASALGRDFVVDTQFARFAIVRRSDLASRSDLLEASARVLVAIGATKPDYPYQPFVHAADLYLAIWDADLASLVVKVGAQGPSGHDAAMQLAGHYRKLGDLDQSVLWYRLAIVRMPAWEAIAYAGLGASYQEQGRLDEAVLAYQKAASHSEDPEVVHYYDELAKVYEQMGRPEDALRAYAAAIGAQPKHPLPHLKVGEYYLKNGRITEALLSLERAVVLEGQGSLAFQAAMDLGGYYRGQKNYDRAAYWYQQAAERMSAWESVAYANLCGMYREQGRVEEALQACLVSVQHTEDPEIATYWLLLGQVYEALNQPVAAANAYRQVLKYRPQDTAAQQRLKRGEVAIIAVEPTQRLPGRISACGRGGCGN